MESICNIFITEEMQDAELRLFAMAQNKVGLGFKNNACSEDQDISCCAPNEPELVEQLRVHSHPPIEETNEEQICGQQLTILLADDSKLMRQALAQRIQSACSTLQATVRFVEASTGEEAFRAISDMHEVIDAVIIDQYMYSQHSKWLGSSVVKELRYCGFKGLIIGCSGNDECKGLFKQAGADHFWGCCIYAT